MTRRKKTRSKGKTADIYLLGLQRLQRGSRSYTFPEALRYLDDAGFYLPKNSSWTRTKDLLIRCQSGRLSYEKYGVAELRGFLAARQAGTTDREGQVLIRKAKKEEIVRRLEVADDTATFRLMDLPPEMRTLIHTMYLDSFPVLPARFVQPPVCLASRCLRQDSLKLFYSRCTFHLTFFVERTYCRGSPIGNFSVRFDSTTLDNVPPEHLAYMSRFEVHLLPRTQALKGRTKSVGFWRIEIGDEEGCVESVEPMRWQRSVCTIPRFVTLTTLDDLFVAMLKKWVNDVSKREGSRKLRIADIESLRLGLEEVVRDRLPWLGYRGPPRLAQ